MPTFDVPHLWSLWNSLTVSQKMAVLQPVAIVVAAILAAVGVGYEVRKSRQREILFRLHEQRKQKYEDLLKIIVPLFSNAGEFEKATKSGADTSEALKRMGFDKEQWLAAHIGLGLYGSVNVVKRYLKWQAVAAAQNPNRFLAVMGHLLLEMREDVGLGTSGLTRAQILATFMTEVDEGVNNEKVD